MSKVTMTNWVLILDMGFNATFKSVLLVEEIGVTGENHRTVASHWPTLSYYVVSSTPCHERGSYSQL